MTKMVRHDITRQELVIVVQKNCCNAYVLITIALIKKKQKNNATKHVLFYTVKPVDQCMLLLVFRDTVRNI